MKAKMFGGVIAVLLTADVSAQQYFIITHPDGKNVLLRDSVTVRKYKRGELEQFVQKPNVREALATDDPDDPDKPDTPDKPDKPDKPLPAPPLPPKQEPTPPMPSPIPGPPGPINCPTGPIGCNVKSGAALIRPPNPLDSRAIVEAPGRIGIYTISRSKGLILEQGK